MKKRILLLAIVLLITGCVNFGKGQQENSERKDAIMKEKGTQFPSRAEVVIDPSKEAVDLSEAVTNLGVEGEKRLEAYQKNSYEFGRWIATTVYSSITGKYEPVFIRLNKIYFGHESTTRLAKLIEINNSYLGRKYSLSSLVGQEKDIEINLLDYEIYIPKDFPIGSEEMTVPDIYLRTRTFDFEAVESKDKTKIYLDLTGVVNILKYKHETYKDIRGQVYQKFCFYPMVEGFRDYGFEVSSLPARSMLGRGEVLYNLIKAE